MIRLSLGLDDKETSATGRPPELQIELDWKSLPEVAAAAPVSPGVYWLGAPFNITYGSTSSRVFYVGSALNLRKRLASHANVKERGNFLLQTFSAGATARILAAFHSVPGLKADNLRGLEYEVIYRFGFDHGFIPHGNRIPPESDSLDYWYGRVQVLEPAIGGESLSPIQIADRYDLIVDHDPYPLFSSLSIDLSSGTATTGPEIYSISFRMKSKPKVKG